VSKKDSATKLKLNTLISEQDLNKRDLVTMDESPTLEEDVETPRPHPLQRKSGETNKTSDPDEDFSEDFEMVNMGDNYPEEDDIKDLETLLEELEQDYDSWVELRRKTVVNLREIADYIDSVSKKSGLAKAIGSGGGIVAGGLTLIGGALTIASAGAALPILLAGTGLGLASGVGGGAAAVTEKVIKSQQMKAAKSAIEEDALATTHLENKVEKVSKDKRITKLIAKDVLWTSTGVTSNSFKIVQLVCQGSGAGILASVGTATAQIFGEDIGREVSKAVLITSGRIFSGAVTVVFGGATMIYDIYRLHKEVDILAAVGSEGTNDIRVLASELEKALESLLAKTNNQEGKGPDSENQSKLTTL